MSTRSQLPKDLYENVQLVLSNHSKILVKYIVKLETKSDKVDTRVLVFTTVRIYLLTAKVPTKIECSFHYLDIQSVESKDAKHFCISTNDRNFYFITTGDAGNFSSNSDMILTDLASAIKQIFPTVPLKYIIRKIDIQPPEREAIFSEEFRPSDPRNVGACGGFSAQYACMCDFYGVSYREEVQWDIDTIYMAHDIRVLNLRDFDHLDSKDLMVIVSALEYNTFFRGLKATHMRLSTETLERIVQVLRRSMWLEELHLEALSFRNDFIQKLSLAISGNNNTVIRSIDLSHNIIEDKGAINLTGAISKAPKGVCKLALAHCGLTAKGVNQIAHALVLNQHISNSLTYLDLSGNSLKDDITNLHNYLAQPNVLEYLDLSSTDITLENLFGALLRGCSTHLAHLNVSHNSFNTKKSREIPPSFKQFFTSTLSLKRLNIAGCKLPMEALKNVLLGLACNESTAGLHLDLSNNSLGALGAHVLESCIHGVRVLQTLDISDNNLEAELAPVLTAVSKNPSIRALLLCRCLSAMKPKNIPCVIDALINLIQKDAFPLTELSLAENKLKTDIHDLINALGSNQSLLKLDISGNFMGDVGARLLAKALQINNKLRTIYLDKNNITLQGYADIVYALEKNHSVRTIPFPVFDIVPQMKNHPEKTDTIMRKMQELLQRNCNWQKNGTGQSLRLQHGFMLISTHQLVDNIIAEIQDNVLPTKDAGSCAAIQQLIQDADNCKSLLPKLQDLVRCESHPVEVKFGRIASELSTVISNYLEGCLETMLCTAKDQCPSALGQPHIIRDLRKMLTERLTISEDFLQNCIYSNAGSEIMNKVSEIEQYFAVTISDRATEEVLEELTRSRRLLGITDTVAMTFNQTPDIVRNRSNHATPYFASRRRTITNKVRPQSVVDHSIGHVPDLLESPSSHHASSHVLCIESSCDGINTETSCTGLDPDGSGGDMAGGEECCDSITELPSASFQLQHLVKGRPKRAKTRAPTRPLVSLDSTVVKEIGQGLQEFFHHTEMMSPTTATPGASSSSEDSSLSFADSPTMSRGENGGTLTSEETTPILEERRSISMETNSPAVKNKSMSWTKRSHSTDNLDNFSPMLNHKCLRKKSIESITKNNAMSSHDNNSTNAASIDGAMPLSKASGQAVSQFRSPSSDSIKRNGDNESNMVTPKPTTTVLRTPILQKPRPWSLLGTTNESTNITPNMNTVVGENKRTTDSNALELSQIEDCDVEQFAEIGGGSIVGITPGIALAGGGTGSGSIVGITPGAALEKKSVREIIAGHKRLE